MLKGIISVIPGYSGGDKEKPSYEEVSSGKTGHAEVVKIEFNPSQISFHDLLTVFFGTHDPTINMREPARTERYVRAGDVGPQYRSAIFYTTEEQKIEAEKFINEINDSNSAGAPVVTEVSAFKNFFEAEDYHKDFYAKNKKYPYCEVIINPKLEKVQKNFTQLLAQTDGTMK